MRWLSTVLFCGTLCSGQLLLTKQALAFTAAQVAQGQQLFARCTDCHSMEVEADLQRGSNRTLVGDTALPPVLTREMYPPIALETVGQVSDLIQTSMPPNSPGALTEAESLALTAFILSGNGVLADGRELNRADSERLELATILPSRRSRRRGWWIAAAVAVAGLTGAGLALRRRSAA